MWLHEVADKRRHRSRSCVRQAGRFPLRRKSGEGGFKALCGAAVTRVAGRLAINHPQPWTVRGGGRAAQDATNKHTVVEYVKFVVRPFATCSANHPSSEDQH
jgi:hypothetical protein